MIRNITIVFKKYLNNYSGLSIECWQGIFLAFLNTLSIGICFFLSLYFVNHLQMKISMVGIIISFYGLGTVIGGLAGGKLSDNFNPLHISIACLIFQSLFFLLLTVVTSPLLLMLNLFFLGISSYGFKTSNNVWILNHQNNRSENFKLKIINIIHAASNLGLGVSGIIIGIFSAYGFQNIFYLSTLILFLSACYLTFYCFRYRVFFKPTLIEKTKLNSNPIKKQNQHIITLMLCSIFLIGLIIAQLSATYPIYVQNAFPELGVKAVSILFLLDTTLIILFQAPLVNFLNNYNKIFLAGFGAFLMGMGMLVLSFSWDFYVAVISCIIWTTGEMLFISMSQFVCYKNAPANKKGQSIGSFQAAFAASAVTGPAFGGFIYRFIGADILWYVCASIGTLIFFLCNSFKKYD